MNNIYGYCFTCKKVIIRNHHIDVAKTARRIHKQECSDSIITLDTKEYFDKHYPDIVLESNRVFLTIQGGCAELVEKPAGIEVEIRDFDVEGIDAEGDERCKKDNEGDWYQEMIWEPTVELP